MEFILVKILELEVILSVLLGGTGGGHGRTARTTVVHIDRPGRSAVPGRSIGFNQNGRADRRL